MAQRIRGRRVPIMEIVGKNGRMTVRNRIVPADGMALNEGPDGTSMLVQPPDADAKDGYVAKVTVPITARSASTFPFTLGKGKAILGKAVVGTDDVESSGTEVWIYNMTLSTVGVGKVIGVHWFLGKLCAVVADCD